MTKPINSEISTLNGVHLFNTHLFKNDVLTLGKNVMLFGTNGVGKSTSLSFIAFFWSGEQNLFVKEKSKADGKRFQDYFFPANNSFLVYQYEKSEHDVLAIIAGKESGNGLICIFVALAKGSYRVEDIFNRDTRAEVLQAIDEIAIDYKEFPFSQYTQILYGQSSDTKDKKYAFSQIRNHRTYAKLHYSSFKHIAINSQAVKSIILEYAEAVKGGYGKEGLNLERHGREIDEFLDKRHAISLWHQSYHTIDKLREGLSTIRSSENKRFAALLEMQREWSWYVSLNAELKVTLGEVTNKYEDFHKNIHPIKKRELVETRKEKQEEVGRLKLSIEALEEKFQEFQEDHELQRMVREIPKNKEYTSQHESAKEILEGLLEKDKPAEEQYQQRLKSIKKAYDDTLESNEKHLTSLEKEYLARELREKNEAAEAVEKLKADYDFIEPLEKECQEQKIVKVTQESELKALKKETFKGSERYKKIDEQKSPVEEKKKALFIKQENLEKALESLKNEDEGFRNKQRESLERKKESTEKEIKALKKELDRLSRLNESEASLFSKIEEAGLDTKKYTSLLNLEALESSDFLLSPDTAGDGMQVFDFILSKDTQLFDSSLSIAQKKDELDNKILRIRKSVQIFEDSQGEQYREFFSVHRPKVTEHNTELDKTKEEHKETGEKLKELNNKLILAEEKWTEEHKVKVETFEKKIKGLNEKLENNNKRIANSKEKLGESIKEIQGNVFNAESAVKKAGDEKEENDKKAKETFDSDSKKAEEAYKKLLSTTGADPEELITYRAEVARLNEKIDAIKQWKMTVLSYQKFIEKEWSGIQGLRAKFRQEKDAFENLDSDTDDKLEELQKEEERLKESVEDIKRKRETLTKKSGILEGYILENKELLTGVEPLADKSDEEKSETDFDSKTDELVAHFTSATSDNAKARKTIDILMSKHWSTFITKKVLSFHSDTLGNAERIVAADGANEIDAISLGLFQSIRQTISIISEGNTALSSTYQEARNAIIKINRDLKDISSTTLIESIELKAVEKESGIQKSMDEMVDYWRDHSEHMMDGLFSQAEDNVHRKKMLDLFDAFTKELALLSSRERKLSVGGMFDLQGRIIEKGNDSGWVDGALGKGSEGTRILIKAAITASLFSMAISESKEKHTPTLLIDEIGKLHNDNVQKILEYINQKGALLIAVQPNNTMAKFFDSAYLLDEVSKTESQVVEYIRKKKPLTFKEKKDVTI